VPRCRHQVQTAVAFARPPPMKSVRRGECAVTIISPKLDAEHSRRKRPRYQPAAPLAANIARYLPQRTRTMAARTRQRHMFAPQRDIKGEAACAEG